MSTPKKKKNMKPRSERYTLSNHVANFFLAAAFAIFPLFVNLTFDGNFPFIHFDNGFILIRHNKYYFFLILTAAAVIMELLLLLTRTVGEKMEKNPDKRAKQKTVSVTDFAVLCFVMARALSTVFSAHLNMALYGEIAVGGATHGRNNGLILMLCYAVVYLLLTRCWRFREYVFLALAGSSVIVYLLAVLNAFYIDPLNMFAQFRNDENVFVNFMTTIGNKNMFSSHICVTLPVLMTMFVHTERLRNKVIYFAAACIGSMAAVVCDSDSVVLGMGAFAMVFLVAYARKPKRLRQFLLMLTASLCSMKLLGVFSALGGDNHKEMGAVLYSVMQSNLTYAVIAVLAALTVGMYVLDRKHHRETLPLAVPIVLGAFFGTVVLAGVGVILYFSLIDTKPTSAAWSAPCGSATAGARTAALCGTRQWRRTRSSISPKRCSAPAPTPSTTPSHPTLPSCTSALTTAPPTRRTMNTSTICSTSARWDCSPILPLSAARSQEPLRPQSGIRWRWCLPRQ